MRIESPGTCSTDDALAECDTTLELIAVSYFTLSGKASLDAHGFHGVNAHFRAASNAQRFTLRARSSLGVMAFNTADLRNAARARKS